MTPNTEIEVGLVGYGLAGRVFHAPVLQAVPGLRLRAIVKRSGDTGVRAAPGVSVVRTVDALLAMDSVRLVVVAAPTTAHLEVAERCLKAGRDVVVDKPFAAKPAEAARIISVAECNGRLLSVFHNRRWDGDFLTVQRLLREGAVGRPVLFESHFDRYRPVPKPGAWRERPDAGGGILLDLGCHLVDQALTLFGQPCAVTADIRTERDGFVTDDAFDVVLHYPRMRAFLRSTMLASDKAPRFVLQGTSGTFVKHDLDPQEERLTVADGIWEVSFGVDPPDRWGTLTQATPDGFTRTRVQTIDGNYRAYYENVRDAINGVAPLAVTPAQACDVIRLIELARESSRQQRTLPWSVNDELAP